MQKGKQILFPKNAFSKGGGEKNKALRWNKVNTYINDSTMTSSLLQWKPPSIGGHTRAKLSLNIVWTSFMNARYLKSGDAMAHDHFSQTTKLNLGSSC